MEGMMNPACAFSQKIERKKRTLEKKKNPKAKKSIAKTKRRLLLNYLGI